MITELEIRYLNAKRFFEKNYDNPQWRDKALETFKRASDRYYAVKYADTTLVERVRKAGL